MNSVDFDRLDSLDGWVAIKSNLFDENETYKLGFIVQWNVIESKFAVTCHNRTLQRQKRKEELAVGDTQTSWAGLFSVNDLKNVHRQFTCVGDVLAPYFPDLADFEEGNIWDLIFFSRTGNQEDQEKDLDTPCRQLEKYFSTAIDVCGRKIVLDSLFNNDERDVEEYFENLQEFKRKTMEDEVARSKDLLRKVSWAKHDRWLTTDGGRAVKLMARMCAKATRNWKLLRYRTVLIHKMWSPVVAFGSSLWA